MEGDGWQVIMCQLSEEEKRKRGCIYCADIKKVKGCHVGQVYVKAYLTCPHDICPYAELDNFNTYKGYLQSDESRFDFLDIPREFNY